MGRGRRIIQAAVELLARLRAMLGEPARRRRLARLRAGELPWRRSWRSPWRHSRFSKPHWKPTPERWWPTPPLDPDEEAAWRELAGDHRAAAIERAAREIDAEVTREIAEHDRRIAKYSRRLARRR